MPRGRVGFRMVVSSTIDADAQAFITAAAITDNTQKSAINTLVTSLKSYNIWTKMKAIYPFVGGTATAHSYNLKNPSQFQITWYGGMTHNSNGITGNLSNSYGDTNFNPQTVGLSTTNAGISIYSRTGNIDTTSTSDIGAVQSSTVSYLHMAIRRSNGACYTQVYDNSFFGDPSLGYPSNPSALGFYTVVRTSNLEQYAYKNGSLLQSRTNYAARPQINLNVFISGRNIDGSLYNSSNRNYSLAAIHDGMDASEAANFYTAVQAYQTTLGRQV